MRAFPRDVFFTHCGRRAKRRGRCQRRWKRASRSYSENYTPGMVRAVGEGGSGQASIRAMGGLANLAGGEHGRGKLRGESERPAVAYPVICCSVLALSRWDFIWTVRVAPAIVLDAGRQFCTACCAADGGCLLRVQQRCCIRGLDFNSVVKRGGHRGHFGVLLAAPGRGRREVWGPRCNCELPVVGSISGAGGPLGRVSARNGWEIGPKAGVIAVAGVENC